MRTVINALMVLIAIFALVATATGLLRRFATEDTNKKALTAVLEKNAVLRMQIAALSLNPEVSKTAPHPGQAKGPWDILESPEYQREKSRALEVEKLNNREFGLKYYAALRSEVDARYGPFYQLQQLNRAQTDVLAEALFQRRLRHDKADADMQAGGSGADTRAEKSAADAELAATVQALLGADLYVQFSLYERQRPAWDYVGSFGGMLSLTDMPLSLEQAARLVDAIAYANTAFQNGDMVKERSRGTAQDWNAVYAIAADFLTPEQLDFFKNTWIPSGGDSINSPQAMGFNRALMKAMRSN